ncbi:hypothetical protein BDZ90DRAFT_259006 [Jaminaea rosea]|uniref:Uncharacterized protein n=1 Tax=Jaminaea rosea TaxID=1569628 RepID=A0A316UUF3_9BASI|nr:hypothetical protein BDZ90DRAFT_259006 [Jaminaea rosea]PWN28937.1 hypothetical protein BDZ90DRAFT_259006 [Jaminaea rosea]
MDGAAGPSDLSHSMYAGNGAAAEGRQSEEAASTQERQRFFPPPFRIDIDLADDDSDDDGASPGPSVVKQEPVDEEFVLSHVTSHAPPLRTSSSTSKPPAKKKKKKQRRLMFSSELPAPSEMNEDGTPSVSYLRYQSTLRLKRKWDSIYAKFQSAHLEPQDELWLGKRMRILKDHGTVRALKEDECAFGSFHIKEEDLDEVERECRRAQGEDVDASSSAAQKEPAEVIEIGSDDDDDDEAEDELGAWDPDFVRSQYKEFQPKKEEDDEGQNPLAGADSEDEEDSSRPMDPDLLAFLEAEKRRREVVGEEEEEEDEDMDVVDLRAPRYDRPRYDDDSSSDGDGSEYSDDSDEEDDEDEYDTNASSRDPTPLDKQQQRRRPAATSVNGASRTGSNGPATPTRKLARADPYHSSGDEMDVLHGVKPGSTQELDSFRRDMEAKKANIERLLQVRESSKEDGSAPQKGIMVHDTSLSGNENRSASIYLDASESNAAEPLCGLGNSLPYSNVPGLAQLLGLPDPVETADDDQREEMAVQAAVMDEEGLDTPSKRRNKQGTASERPPRHSTPPPPGLQQTYPPAAIHQADHYRQLPWQASMSRQELEPPSSAMGFSATYPLQHQAHQQEPQPPANGYHDHFAPPPPPPAPVFSAGTDSSSQHNLYQGTPSSPIAPMAAMGKSASPEVGHGAKMQHQQPGASIAGRAMIVNGQLSWGQELEPPPPPPPPPRW